MSRARFLRDVDEALGGVGVGAERAVAVVFEALHNRMTFGQVLEMSSHLPEGLDDLWTMPGFERLNHFLGGVMPIELDEFLERVRRRAELSSVGEARIAALAVFKALKKGLSTPRQREVAKRFSPALRALWLEA